MKFDNNSKVKRNIFQHQLFEVKTGKRVLAEAWPLLLSGAPPPFWAGNKKYLKVDFAFSSHKLSCRLRPTLTSTTSRAAHFQFVPETPNPADGILDY